MHPSYSIWDFGEYLMKDLYRCQYYNCEKQRTLPFTGCSREHTYAITQIKQELIKRQNSPFTQYSDVPRENGNLMTYEMNWTSKPFTDFDLTIDEVNHYAKLI